MKKIIFILLLLICAQTLQAQGVKMRITPKTGAPYTYTVDSIAKMTFRIGPPPKYDYVNFYSSSTSPTLLHVRTRYMDSITYGYDSIYKEFLSFPQRGGKPNMSYTLKGKYGLDSISFSSFQIDTNIVTFTDRYWNCTSHDSSYGYYRCATWVGNHIFCGSPYRSIEIDSAYHVIKDFTPCPNVYSGMTFAANSTGTKFLNVTSKYLDASIGVLNEYDMQTGVKKLLFTAQDSEVSSAVYYGTDDVIYYTYGEIKQGKDTSYLAGYYLFNRSTGERTQLLHYVSEWGPLEMVNGFDVSPDGKKLLIPTVRRNDDPLLIEYDLITHISDTLQVPFKYLSSRMGLWLRYSHGGSKILYSNYPMNSFAGEGVYNSSYIGIIDRATLSNQILHTELNDERPWVALCPAWSPDDKSIVYCSGFISIEPPGSLVGFRVCILKSLK